jgi:polyhydroxybutyrate depolymerase
MKRAVLVVILAACDESTSGSPDAPGGGGTDAAVDASIDAMGSIGCGPTGAATGQTMETITVGGVARTYLRVVPATYDPMRTYPLIFAWHGRTGSAMGARQYFGMQTAVGDNAIVVYPQGLTVTAGTPSDTGWILTPAGRDVALFDAIQTAMTSSYCVGRTYSMGHSFGGYMSNALACARGGTEPGKVRAIASIAGGGPFGACTNTPLSALIIHGNPDGTVPFAEGTASRDKWLTGAACATTTQPITPSPCVAYDGCSAGLAVRFCEHMETAGGGHGWPSWSAGAAWKLFQDSP